MKRVIARLDIKLNRLIKGIHLEGWRFLGDPKPFFMDYYESGIDEIVYIDSISSLYNRNSMKELVSETTRNVFVPITVGGGIRTVEQAYEMLRSGADKVAINTGAIKNPELITEVAKNFGSQCMVISIQAKRVAPGKWEAYIDTGRESSGKDVIEWVREAVDRGAGEIFLTSVDMDGTTKGMDLALIEAVSKEVDVPVIASGGFGKPTDFIDACKYADAVAIAKQLHYKKVSIQEIKKLALQNNINVRFEE
jgi:imidazole glycerol-phosphate synthase subunit HisF